MYIAELRKFASTCDIQDYLEQDLRDCLVYGLKAEHIQKRLFTEVDLPLKRA